MTTFEVHVFDSVGNAPIGPPAAQAKITTSASSQATSALNNSRSSGYAALRIKCSGADVRYEIGAADGSTPTADANSILLSNGDWEWIYVESGTILAVINA